MIQLLQQNNLTMGKCWYACMFFIYIGKYRSSRWSPDVFLRHRVFSNAHWVSKPLTTFSVNLCLINAIWTAITVTNKITALCYINSILLSLSKEKSDTKLKSRTGKAISRGRFRGAQVVCPHWALSRESAATVM